MPGRIEDGVPVEDLLAFLVAPFLIGVLFVLVYYRTGNLFVTVGLHALFDDPMLVVDAGTVVLVTLPLVVLGVLLAGPSLASWVGRGDRRPEVATSYRRPFPAKENRLYPSRRDGS